LNYNSNLCLQPVPDPFQNITDNGVRIAQMVCGTTLSEQRWQFLQVGTSGGRAYYYLINQRSGKCLDVTDANTSDRATIQQFDCNGGGSEMWFAKTAERGPSGLPSTSISGLPSAWTRPERDEGAHLHLAVLLHRQLQRRAVVQLPALVT
jgi:hypothetical protein